MNVAGWRKPQAAGKLRPQVADNVAEKIARDDDVELSRIADNLHRQGVDIQVAGVDGRAPAAGPLVNSPPEGLCKRPGHWFLAQSPPLQSGPARSFSHTASWSL